MGAFVSFFFGGFIMGKIPFPLSPSFRIMLQAHLLTFLILFTKFLCLKDEYNKNQIFNFGVRSREGMSTVPIPRADDCSYEKGKELESLQI